MINLNANVSQVPLIPNPTIAEKAKASGSQSGFGDALKAVENYMSKVEDVQHASETSIQDLLTGKNEDIATVVSAVAKADMSFKLLVGVRNQLIEAYKQTMNMPL